MNSPITNTFSPNASPKPRRDDQETKLPLKKLRVLVVDDSVVVRRIVSDVLNADAEIEVVGTAANGKIGLGRIEQLKPDLVTLDIEMPEMNGLETLVELRKRYPRLPVIMFSTLTERGAAATLETLELGANDYVTKPSSVKSIVAGQEMMREQLIPRIKGLCRRFVAVEPVVRKLPPIVAPVFRPRCRVDVVTIGISTGGPNALCEFLPHFPADFPVPILIVQHMPPMFTRLLAERLDKQCQISVVEGVPGQKVIPGTAYLAPGDYHMTVHRGIDAVWTGLNQDEPENSCRPAADVLFRSVVTTYGNGTLGVVMTGMGQDGMKGCEKIREAGGQVVVQDEDSSVVWGMPGSVVRAGLADLILPLNQLGPEVRRRVSIGERERIPTPESESTIPEMSGM